MSKGTRDEYPFRMVSIPVYDTFIREDDGYGHGYLTFHTNPTKVIVDDKEIGYVSGGIGMELISIGNGGENTFAIWHDDLWNAVKEAIEKERA